MPVSEDLIWNIIKSHSDQNGLLKHQTVSFDTFINHSIEETLLNNPIKTSDGSIYQFKNAYIPKPFIIDENRKIKKLYPNEARTRDMTYCSPLLVDIVEHKNENIRVYNRVKICNIPIMLCSSHCNLNSINHSQKIQKGECEYDKGGYFIIRGKERVLISQLRSCYNTPLVFDNSNDKYEYVCEVRSMSESTGHSVVVKTMLGYDNRTIKAELPYIKEAVNIGIIFKCLGFVTYEEIEKLIGVDHPDMKKFLRYIVRDSFCNDLNIGEQYYNTYSKSGAGWKDLPETERLKWEKESIINTSLEYLGSKNIHNIKKNEIIMFARQLINVELFPHLGITATNKEKALFLGYMINKLLSTKIGLRDYDDRDNYSNKRIETPGILCSELFTQLFKKFRESILNNIEKKKIASFDIVQIVSKNTMITTGFMHCFSTGNWGVPKTSYIRQGVSQVLSRLSYGSTLSHLRRLCIPIGKEGKNTKIRQINPSQIMFICPCETPEGQSVGIVMNFSLLTNVSEYYPTCLVRDKIQKIDYVTEINKSLENYNTKVFVNGIIIGYTEYPEKLKDEVSKMKKNDELPYDISVSYNSLEDELRIYSDAGRLIRPVFNVKDNILKITEKEPADWKYLVDNDYISYIDNSEAEESVIAFNQNDLTKYSNHYCEISPAMMLGVMGCIIPWPDHSQSPRNCYQTSMGKQAMSMYALSYNNRSDTIAHVLGYPQKPLVGTKPADMMGFNDMPSGINTVVAIACYSGFNQEDSVIINKSAVDRGLFHASSYRTHVDNERKNNTYMFERICQPPLNKRKTDVNYSFLDSEGIIMKRFPNGKNIFVNKGDVIIGKALVDTSKNNNDFIEDCSVIIKKGEEGWVDRIIKTKTSEGNLMVKIIIRRDRIPEVGDKFASRAAQKGTCGIMYTQEDMPWTSEGIVPDIIINPHCIPSRMTINQLMESTLSKTCSINGTFGDATPFSDSSINIAEKLCDDLQMTGYSRNGTEILYSGFSGEPMGEYFIGMVYYQRLKHLVDEKLHARSTGPITTLTRQPLEGRSRDGGLRFGEMERDAMIAHGTSMFLKERLCDQSDPYTIPLCKNCGNISTYEYCISCKSDNISKVGIPYVSKLVIQELNAMCIKTNIKSN